MFMQNHYILEQKKAKNGQGEVSDTNLLKLILRFHLIFSPHENYLKANEREVEF